MLGIVQFRCRGALFSFGIYSASFFFQKKLTTPFFFSQKKSGKKEKGRTATYQDKFSTYALKFPKRLRRVLVGNFLTRISFNLYLGIPLVREYFFKS